MYAKKQLRKEILGSSESENNVSGIQTQGKLILSSSMGHPSEDLQFLN